MVFYKIKQEMIMYNDILTMALLLSIGITYGIAGLIADTTSFHASSI